MKAMMETDKGLSPDDSVPVANQDDWVMKAVGLRRKYCRDLRRSLWYSLGEIVEGLGFRRTPSEVLREHEFWAVDGVSLQLNRGDSLGLLGRNGAGKSTLLKLLTGQRSLTAGTVMTRGRVVALTDLGLGFDPALTGRENAYINAAIHGVSLSAFEQLIEQVIDFSELREFIDSAVHTYSTGMKARLGFSIATHLKPDILIVDEVLAVGDLDFRRKCVQHVLGYVRSGGAVILVAHDPNLVHAVCNRAIILDRGRIVFEGSAIDGVDAHFRLGHMDLYAAVSGIDDSLQQHDVDGVDQERKHRGVRLSDLPDLESIRPELSEECPVIIDRIEVLPTEGKLLQTGMSAQIVMRYRSRIRADVMWGFTIRTADLVTAIASCALGMDGRCDALIAGEHRLVCLLPELLLRPGVYAIQGGISEATNQAELALLGYDDPPGFFTVVTNDSSSTNNWHLLRGDLVLMKAEWPSASVGGTGRATETRANDKMASYC